MKGNKIRISESENINELYSLASDLNDFIVTMNSDYTYINSKVNQLRNSWEGEAKSKFMESMMELGRNE